MGLDSATIVDLERSYSPDWHRDTGVEPDEAKFALSEIVDFLFEEILSNRTPRPTGRSLDVSGNENRLEERIMLCGQFELLFLCSWFFATSSVEIVLPDESKTNQS